MVLTKYGWEKDIIFMPQDMTEDVLTMIFKITYFTLANPTNQQKLAGNLCEIVNNHRLRYAIAS